MKILKRLQSVDDDLDVASSLSNTGDLLKVLEPEIDLNELIPSYVFDIVETDRKNPFL